jgi:hypothetical protein
VHLVVRGFLVWLIIPGVGLPYGGLERRKSALSMVFQSPTVVAITTFQRMFRGFLLAYSRTASLFIGDLKNFGLINATSALSIGSPYIPDIAFASTNSYSLPVRQRSLSGVLSSVAGLSRLLSSASAGQRPYTVQSPVGHVILTAGCTHRRL